MCMCVCLSLYVRSVESFDLFKFMTAEASHTIIDAQAFPGTSRNLNTNTASHRPNTSTGTSRNPYTNTALLIDED